MTINFLVPIIIVAVHIVAALPLSVHGQQNTIRRSLSDNDAKLKELLEGLKAADAILVRLLYAVMYMSN